MTQTRYLNIIIAYTMFAAIAVSANDTMTVFTDGDAWTCFGDELECSGFMGAFESVPPEYGVQLSMPAGQTVAVGQNTTYYISVRNSGETTDSFTLSATAGSANATLNQTATGTLAPGENVTVLLQVSSVSPGNYTTTMTATSDTAPSVFSQESITTTVVSGPTISSTTVLPRYSTVGGNVTISITTVSAINASIAITMPNGTVTTVQTGPDANITYTTSSAGIHNITIIATDAYNQSANATDTFQTFPPTQFNLTILDSNISGVAADIRIRYNGTLLDNTTTPDGNYSTTTIAETVDLEITAYGNQATAYLRGIDTTAESGETFRIDDPAIPGFITAYAFDSSYAFANATVTISYNGTGYSDDRYLTLHVCHDYNFSNQSCDTSFVDITANTTQDFARKTLTTTVNGFSAFAVRQETSPSEDTDGPSGDGCSYRIDCEPWPDACQNGMRVRSCAYTQSCDNSKKIYQEARRCDIDQKPPAAVPLQMVGFIDLADSRIPVGGIIRVKLNVQTPDENAAVAFLYQIDGPETLQDVTEERIIDRSGSFYTSIDAGTLPPGEYTITIKARYAGEQTMLKERFTIIAPILEESTAVATAEPPLTETPAPVPPEARPSVWQDALAAIAIIGEVMMTPVRALFSGAMIIPTIILGLLLIATLSPVTYVVVKKLQKRADAGKKAGDAAAPTPAAVTSTPAPAAPTAIEETITVDAAIASTTAITAAPATTVPPAAIAAPDPAVERTRGIAAKVAQATEYGAAHDAYVLLHDAYRSLPEGVRPQVREDILRAQSHIETLYFDKSLVELDALLATDLHAALELYRRLSTDADRMSPEQFQRLIEHSHSFAERVGLK